MILADTSLWIDLLIDPKRVPGGINALGQVVTCGPIVQEVLQGLDENHPSSAAFRQTFLEVPRVSDPLSFELFLDAATIYQDGRRRGYPIRSTIDCLIAAIAIQHGIPVWHRDRDFTMIARYTRLKAISQYLT